MKAVMVMFDSLNRHFLPNYGCNWVTAPNFERLGEKTVTFDNYFCGSMPCMPARRDLHTGRYTFLHRSWGPLEPFDNSMPEILRDNGVYTHLVSDHYHYWEDGGATYHNRYSSWEGIRGQEGDRWKGHVVDPEPPQSLNRKNRHDWINREYLKDEDSMPQAQTFARGLEFIEQNHAQDSWFLQIETFDPHEPFFVQERWQRYYEDGYDGPLFDWPAYRPVQETEEEVAHVRNRYSALVTMCDNYLGKIIDAFDRHRLWDDTMLIVNTDHGFLLGEHGWWAKGVQPCYNEIAHIPLFVYDPRAKDTVGSRRNSLCQMIDLSPTLLRYFGLTPPAETHGKNLEPVIRDDDSVHPGILFGFHAGEINWTDGRILYMRAPEDDSEGAFNFTLMPTHMRNPFPLEELRQAELTGPFNFTKGVRVLKVPAPTGAPGGEPAAPRRTLLFDVQQDHRQVNPLKDDEIEKRAQAEMVELMKEIDAPQEVFERYGLATTRERE
jgi:arylsulfatase A-like enzyme